MPEPSWKNTTLKGLAIMAITKAQLERMALSKPVKADVSPVWAMVSDQWRTARRAKNYRKWRTEGSV
jgi:hypothetical protein